MLQIRATVIEWVAALNSQQVLSGY